MKKSISLVIATMALSITAHANLIADPGFEGFGVTNGNGAPFPLYPTTSNGWSASQTDGEVFLSVLGRPSHSGEYYADLLQNAGGNPNTPWDETVGGFGGYDRIVTLINVNPNTTYDLSFWHAGGDRFGYVSFETLVQIQSMNTTDMMTMTVSTPNLYDWQQVMTTFTTDSSTTQIALQFSAIGAGDASTLIDDVDFEAQLVPEPASIAAIGLGLALLVRRRKR